MSDVCKERNATIIEMEADADHFHILVSCDPQYGIHRLVKQMKGRSSFVLRNNFQHLKSRLPTLLGYKLADRAGTLVKIGRFYPSSKTCSFCGYKLEALPLNIRSWTCQDCGSHHDRDVNAAINIQHQGILKLKAEGFTVSASGGKRNSRPVSGLVAAVEAGSPCL